MTEILIPSPLSKIKVEDMTIDDLRHLSKDSFALWTQVAGVRADGHLIDFEKHRYLLPVYLCQDSEIVWQKAAQMGATVYMLLKIIWWLQAHPGRKAGFYGPTQQMVENTSKDRLAPLLRSIPALAGQVDENDKLGLRKIGDSSFYLFHLGGVASKDSVPLDFVAFDEVRLCKAQDIDQTLERISHSIYKEKIFMSTAGLPSNDIAARFDLGTQHIWMAKCFTGNTKIWVRDRRTNAVGLKSFTDLKTTWQHHDALGVDTQHKHQVFRPITHFHENGKRDVSKLLFKNGTEVVCTPDHQFAWASKKKLTTIGYVEAQNILKPDHRYDRNQIVSVSHVGTEKFSDGTVESQVPYDNELLWIIGAFLAEGSWKSDVTLNFAQLEGKNLHTRVQDWACKNNLTVNATKVAVDVGISSRPDLISLFEQCGRGCENKQLPEALRTCTPLQATYVLDGYLAGDGCFYTIPFKDRHEYRLLSELRDSSNAWDATTTSRKLAADIQYLALRSGRYTRIKSVKVTRDKLPAWTISYHPNTKAMEELNFDLCTTQLVEINSVGQEEVFDITVEAAEDRNHNFVLENGVVVHNCGCTDGVDLARTFPDCVVDDKKRGKLYLRCPKCKYVINDPQNGRFVPHNPGASYTSFHVSQLTSKFISLKEIWDAYHRTTNKAEFFNAKLGIPFIDEENRGVTKAQLESCIDPALEWQQPKKAKNVTAMGVDQGGGYCYVVIADIVGGKKRIRHVEIIESDNPNYMELGKKVSPFKRLRELMTEFNVNIAVVDAMPNFNEAFEFAHAYIGKVFVAYYAKEAKDIVAWGDKPKVKVTLKKAGPLLKFKYHAILGRYVSMSYALGEWANGNVICPDPDKLVQMVFDEKTKILQPEAIMNRAFSMFMRLVKQFHVTNEETGEGRHEWIYAGMDPHFSHSWNYCNVALERLKRQTQFVFI